MPLSAVDFVPLTGQIKAASHKQFFDLFTGVMIDQPVTFANTLQIGGSQGAGAAPVRINGVAAQTANMVEVRALAADVQPLFSISPTGTLAWGPGGAVGTDVTLARSAANQLTLTGLAGTPALVIPVGGLRVSAGNVGIGGAAPNFTGLNLASSLAGSGAGQWGINSQPTGGSDATAQVMAFVAQPTTAAAVFTCAQVAGFRAVSPTRGAGSTITSAYGLLVDAITVGSTNNYGVFVNAPSGGTGNNYAGWFAGNVNVSGASLRVGLGIQASQDNTTVQGITLPNNAAIGGSGLAFAWTTYASVDHAREYGLYNRTIPDALAKVRELRGYHYDHVHHRTEFDSDGRPVALIPLREGSGELLTRRTYGFAPSDVAAIVPELVASGPDGKPLAVDISRLVPILWEAVRELSNQLAALQPV